MTIRVLNPFSYCLPVTKAGMGTYKHQTINGVCVDKKGN